PANIFRVVGKLNEGGFDYVLIDFGVSVGFEAEEADEAPAASLVSLDTVGGMRIGGTPAFMPPEQFQGGKLTEACDLWSLGVTLFMLLKNDLPFHLPKGAPNTFWSNVIGNPNEWPVDWKHTWLWAVE
ncbi:hypothetical protein T484DRAFT_1861875, partial [Baffinella frigidus]